MSILAWSDATTNTLIAAIAGLVGVGIGGLITLATTGRQHRQQEAARKADAAATRRDRAAAILGRVSVFLTDIDPERIGINVDPERTPALMDSLGTRLHTLREELSVFAFADEDERVMDKTGQLEVALYSTYHWVGWLASDLLKRRGGFDSFHAARREHLRARALTRIVLDLVHGRDIAPLEAELEEGLLRLKKEEQDTAKRVEEASEPEPGPSAPAG